MDRAKTLSLRKIVTFETMVFSIAFLVPLLFNNVQLVTGSIVNAVLFLSATRLQNKKLLFLAVLPSIGALAHGILFGAFTIYLVYFLPCIWIGNYILMQIARSKSMTIAAIAKCLLLFVVAYIYVYFHIVPKIFLTAMGPLQLATAFFGGMVAVGIQKYLPAHD